MKLYERVDKSEGVNSNKKASECIIWHYWYFADGFKY